MMEWSLVAATAVEQGTLILDASQTCGQGPTMDPASGKAPTYSTNVWAIRFISCVTQLFHVAECRTCPGRDIAVSPLSHVSLATWAFGCLKC